MKRLFVILSCLLLPALSYAEIFDGLSQGASKSHASDTGAAKMPMAAPEGPKGEGKVLSVVNGSGYSYVELENNGQKFWVAGTQVAVAKGDKISYVENVVMEKFFSKTLQREFDRIIFASHLQKQ